MKLLIFTSRKQRTMEFEKKVWPYLINFGINPEKRGSKIEMMIIKYLMLNENLIVGNKHRDIQC